MPAIPKPEDRADTDPTEYRQFRFRLPPGGTDLLLVRHGESQPARLDEPFPVRDGQADPPLDPWGRKEAERVAERLADERLDAIYVTPLRRTGETAEPLARRLGLEPRVEPDLREVHLGEWEGAVFRARVQEGDPLARRLFTEERWDVIPGAESLGSVHARVRAAVGRIVAAHPDQRVAVFTHGGIIGTIAALATESRRFAFVAADNASITHLVVAGDRWILRRFNDTGHLDTDLDRPPEPLT
jgi:2,3-bisphosphoglycerate-dependent phosphoglycerate mutase